MLSIWIKVHNTIQVIDGKDKIATRVHPENQNIIVEVTDSGSVMLTDIQDHIIQPFSTTQSA